MFQRGSAQTFYDQLAGEYHLIFADWRRSVRGQGQVLDSLIRKEMGAPSSVLDCTCGIGTQAIGLALQGYQVRGTDVSPQAINRAKREADSFGVSIEFGVADLLTLDRQVAGPFDLVISCDNALPHLLSDHDLDVAAHNIWSKVTGGGVFLASIRDYDAILEDRPKSTLPQVIDDADGRRVVFQVWDWLEDERNYTLHLFILREIQGDWRVAQYSSRYRAMRRQELTHILSRAGFSSIRWLMPAETGYYQPMAISRKA